MRFPLGYVYNPLARNQTDSADSGAVPREIGGFDFHPKPAGKGRFGFVFNGENTMTRPTYDVQTLSIEGADGDSGFEGLWDDHDTGPDGEPVKKPEFIDTEAPGPGESSRSLPSTKRTTPLIYVHEDAPREIEWGDITHSSQDYQFACRMEVVIADEMDGRSGKGMRDAVIHVLENIREDQRAPTDGVFGSDFQELNLINIDTTPTRFTNQWRAYYDVQYEADSVI